MSKETDISTILLIIILLSIITFSPQITNMFKGMTAITGRAEGSYDLNVSVGNIAPKITNINTSVPADADVTAGGIKLLNFTFVACDQDQQNNDLIAHGNYTGENDVFDGNLTCKRMAWSNTTCQQFNCTYNLYSWYKEGSWNFSFNITDGSAWAHSNGSTNGRTWTLGTTTAITIHPANISWSSLNLGSWNNTAVGDPIVINNTGNKNISYAKGAVNITGYDLKGESTKTQYIPGINFTVNLGTGPSKPECGNWTMNGTAIVNKTSVNIGGSMLTRGNYTINDGSTGQEQLYFCLRHVPSANAISTQSYSTQAFNPALQWKLTVS